MKYLPGTLMIKNIGGAGIILQSIKDEIWEGGGYYKIHWNVKHHPAEVSEHLIDKWVKFKEVDIYAVLK